MRTREKIKETNTECWTIKDRWAHGFMRKHEFLFFLYFESFIYLSYLLFRTLYLNELFLILALSF